MNVIVKPWWGLETCCGSRSEENGALRRDRRQRLVRVLDLAQATPHRLQGRGITVAGRRSMERADAGSRELSAEARQFQIRVMLPSQSK
jgi:hypothetical protein